jgi:hypothetical protein
LTEFSSFSSFASSFSDGAAPSAVSLFIAQIEPLAFECETYIWTAPISELVAELWSYAAFIQNRAWAWIGEGNNDFYEVDSSTE